MKKTKRILIIFLLLAIIFSNSNTVFAAKNNIDEIFIDVEILEDGTGIITQRWITNIGEGTEFFIPFQNLNHMEIIGYTVEDEDGKYEFMENWDSKKSFDEKSRKYGILETSDGIELCFGVSKYGSNEYIIRYSFTNMVQSFSDKDGFNVRILNNNMSPTPNRVSFNIHSGEVQFSESNSKIWAFGYPGNIDFSNGSIVGKNTSELNSDNHFTILMEIDKGLISPNYKGEGTFEDLKTVAFKGSKYKAGDSEFEHSNKSSIMSSSGISFPLGLIISIVGLFLLGLIATLNNISTKVKNYHEFKNGMLINEIPFNGEILPTYYFLNLDTTITEDIKAFNLLSAYIIKWFGEGNLNEKYEFIKDPISSPDSTEFKLWEFVKNGSDGFSLKPDEFEEYMEKKYMKFHYIATNAITEGYKYAKDNGYIDIKKRFFIFRDKYLNTKGINEMLKLLGTKENIARREGMFENLDSKKDYTLFMFAALFGLNDKFKIDDIENQKFYTEYPQYYPYYLFFNSTNTIANSASRGFERGFDASGGGGSASFGGGGGFSGGGSGGGVR